MRKDESHLVVGNYPYIFFNYYKRHTHISFSVILAGILRAGKKHFLGNLAVRFVCRMRSTACAQRIPLIFRGKTSAAFPDGSSTTYRFFM